MKGLEAVTAHNGWAISIVGASIVFTGLTSLALIISQIHKVLDFWENRTERLQQLKELLTRKKEVIVPLADSTACMDVRSAVNPFKLLSSRIGQPFSLPQLIKVAEKFGQLRPHYVINGLLVAGVITPDGEGFFLWNEEAEKRLLAE